MACGGWIARTNRRYEPKFVGSGQPEKQTDQQHLDDQSLPVFCAYKCCKRTDKRVDHVAASDDQQRDSYRGDNTKLMPNIRRRSIGVG